MKMRRIFFFHPEMHHAIFLINSFRKAGLQPLILCPDYVFRLAAGRLHKVDGSRFPFQGCSLLESSCLLLFNAVLAFFKALYYLRLLSLNNYYFISDFGAQLCLKILRHELFYSFQDYAKSTSVLARWLNIFIVNENLISTQLFKKDHKKLCQVSNSLANIVVYPSENLQISEQPSKETQIQIVNYGGDFDMRGLPLQKSEFKHNSQRLVCCARAPSYRKGGDNLLQALIELSISGLVERDSLCVRILGEITEPPLLDLLNRCSSIGIIPVTHRQYPVREVRTVMASSDFFVMPSRSEGQPYAALEAINLGLPLVVSRECNLDHFRDGVHGFLLEHLDSASLTKKMRNILANPEQLSYYRSQLASLADIYSWNNYEELVST